MHTTVRRKLPFTVVALLVTAAAPLPAQPGVLVGRVLTDEGAAIAGAEVRTSFTQEVVRTAADGSFRVPGVPSGLYYFGIRQEGYHPVTDLLRFSANDTLQVFLERVVASRKLDTLQVQARSDAAWERDMRRYGLAIEASAMGTVLTEQDIARRNPIWTSDLFLNMNGFSVSGGGGAARVFGSRSQCLPALFLDGQFAPAFRVNDIAPAYIKLLITYRGASTVPAQFQDPRANTNCGTIALFTL